MDKIQTLHPKGKQGVSIDKSKYEVMKATILETLRIKGPQSFNELLKLVEKQLKSSFDGSISWYYTTVKLDLEARKEIISKRGKSGMVISLVSQAR